MGERWTVRINALMVGAYKTLGTVALGAILLGLLSYLGLQAFFVINRSWVAPAVMTPSDPRILELNGQLALQSAARDRVLAEGRETEASRAEAVRLVQAQRAFQERFRSAWISERAAQRQEHQRLAQLHAQYQEAGEAFLSANQAFGGLVRVRSEALREAKLMDQERYLTSNHLLAQMSEARLTLSEKQANLVGRMEGLRREMQGSEGVARRLDHPEGAEQGRHSLTPTTLMLEQAYTRSVLERTSAEEKDALLGEKAQDLSRAAERYDGLLMAIHSSPYLKAIRKGLTVAFVPYENLEQALPGTPLYGCSFVVLGCHRVGAVGALLEGEVTFKHPVRQRMLRGVMVELELEEASWVREELLHVGRAPFFL